MSVLSIVRSLGGVARASEIAEAGYGPGAIRVAVAAGTVWRPRKGWYVDPALGPDAVRAVRVGGALACASAAAHHRLWVREPPTLHVEVPASAARLRAPTDRRRRLTELRDAGETLPVIHWSDRPARGIQSVVDCLVSLGSCGPADDFFAALESALTTGRLDLDGRALLLARVPARLAHLVTCASAQSESGTESLVKLALLARRIPFRQQVKIPGVGRVDFLIGERLVIEVDSRSFHSDPYRDRRRDAELSRLGYRSLRFIYAQVVHELDHVMAAIDAALTRGDHRA